VECISSSVTTHLNTAAHKKALVNQEEQEEGDARLRGDLVLLYAANPDMKFDAESQLTYKPIYLRKTCAKPRELRELRELRGNCARSFGAKKLRKIARKPSLGQSRTQCYALRAR
jgi:hypothetical protein